MSESEGNNTEAEVLVEELCQKLTIAQEELEMVRHEAEQVKWKWCNSLKRKVKSSKTRLKSSRAH